MPLSQEPGHDEQQFVRYLLGLLSDEETERVDELSVADDDAAWRLRVVENDLVDAYVRGTLAGDMRERFESFYLVSPLRREKVRFAESFLRVADAAVVPPRADADREPVVMPVTRQERPTPVRLRWFERIIPRSTRPWAFAAAVATVLFAGSGLLLHDLRLQRALSEATRERAALDRRAVELEQQLNDQRSVRADDAAELARVRALLAQQSQGPAGVASTPSGKSATSALTTIALLLVPQTRAVATVATMPLPTSTERAAFTLRLDASEFSRYQVALKDPANGEVVWQSGRLAARRDGDTRSVSVTVPPGSLKVQHYSFELTGLGADGATAVVGSYAFRVLPR